MTELVQSSKPLEERPLQLPFYDDIFQNFPTSGPNLDFLPVINIDSSQRSKSMLNQLVSRMDQAEGSVVSAVRDVNEFVHHLDNLPRDGDSKKESALNEAEKAMHSADASMSNARSLVSQAEVQFVASKSELASLKRLLSELRKRREKEGSEKIPEQTTDKRENKEGLILKGASSSSTFAGDSVSALAAGIFKNANIAGMVGDHPQQNVSLHPSAT